ncbi:MAG: hypothetical protein AB7N31_17565 [Pyrinomonadaceae bacterium]
MPRKTRIEIEGGLYHVITRGNGRRERSRPFSKFHVTKYAAEARPLVPCKPKGR